MNQAVSDRRLLKLAAFLKTVPRKRFDYRNWVGADWQGAQDLSCGTTACALGWAATMPEFRRLGLRLRKSVIGGQVALGKTDESAESAEEAASHIFGLGAWDTCHLFYPDFAGSPPASATPKEVARHIERFVKNRAA